MVALSVYKRRSWFSQWICRKFPWLDGITDGHEFEWPLGVGRGQGGLVCCNSWDRKESETTEWLNWTELPGCRNHSDGCRRNYLGWGKCEMYLKKTARARREQFYFKKLKQRNKRMCGKLYNVQAYHQRYPWS